MSEKITGQDKPQLSRAELQRLLQVNDIDQISFARLAELIRQEPELARYRPDDDYQVDPRSGDRIVYNSARGKRPHDNRPAGQTGQPAKDCIVCQGKITHIVDVAELSEGFTFINKNLYPVLYPGQESLAYRADWGEKNIEPPGRPAYGLHLLQWTSSLHDHDWPNMPRPDRVVVLQRLAVLEKKLLTGAAEVIPPAQLWHDGEGRHGFVSIFKNYGRLVGGSLAHSHQQIAFSNMMPRRVRDNWRFQQQQGDFFSGFLLRENPAGLLLHDYGPAALLVPYFMRRPFEMMFLLKDVDKRYLHELSGPELAAVADAWRDASRVMLWALAESGREPAYNIIAHTGPGAGFYLEFLPYTQETGGFEHLGLFICQANPHDTAGRIRAFLSGQFSV